MNINLNDYQTVYCLDAFNWDPEGQGIFLVRKDWLNKPDIDAALNAASDSEAPVVAAAQFLRSEAKEAYNVIELKPEIEFSES